MNIFKTSQTIGDIVSIMPKASDVFREYNIDQAVEEQTLASAIEAQNLDEKEILQKLDEAYN